MEAPGFFLLSLLFFARFSSVCYTFEEEAPLVSPSEEEPDSSWLEKASEESREDCRKKKSAIRIHVHYVE